MYISSLKNQARQLKLHVLTVYFAAREPGMPFIVKCLALIVAAYALSPIDLIPDFIPVIGYLDDLIIIPLALAMILHFTPPDVIKAARLNAEQVVDKPVSYMAAVFIVIIWFFILYFCIDWLLNIFST